MLRNIFSRFVAQFAKHRFTLQVNLQLQLIVLFLCKHATG